MATKQSSPFAIVYVPIGDLNPSPYNPRKCDDQQKENVKESIRRFGCVDPIICQLYVKRKNTVIGGHLRLLAMKELGYTEVPVYYVTIEDLEREKELNLRLNLNTGSWDFDILKEFDMGLLLDVGFTQEDLGSIWDKTLSVDDDDFNVEKELKTQKTTDIKVGDYFQLGRHFLICGDSTDPAVVKRLVGKNRMHILYLDPPYNRGLDYNKGMGEKASYGGKTRDDKTDEEYKSFLLAALRNGLDVAQPDCHVFMWCDDNYMTLIQNLYRQTGIDFRRIALWLKNNYNPSPRVAFGKAYEPCIYGTRGEPYLSPDLKNPHSILDKEIGTGNRMVEDIFDQMSIWLAKRQPTQLYCHPCEKPPTLHEKPLRRCSRPGDNILDLHGGSGSLLISCEQLKRTAFIAEIEPIFINLIITRYEQLTGNKAKKLN